MPSENRRDRGSQRLKLALFGVMVAAAGFAFDVEGLVYSGALWVAAGLLITAILAMRGETGPASSGPKILDPREIGQIQGMGGPAKSGTWPGFFFMLAIGLGSMSIGIFGIGFAGDDDYLRWLPIVVGAVFTLLTLISLPVRLGRFDPEAALVEVRESSDLMKQGRPETGDHDPTARLEKLEELRRSGLITPDEFETQRQRILGSL